ncbi:hypothetical protein O5O45_07620 [Hahella aquimaris]|uniref:hypothetical protein n=1 Tax=Hahella sp. HNIBRBA332 TaxID=3015983 RepID=UPI00273C1E73|nr:hypothetical protein [Hahella sp. HNIBRBA332]WLQ15781.1 hypothetical protein O5O45_07620 [Hahella sp. HNIBRBA332]
MSDKNDKGKELAEQLIDAGLKGVTEDMLENMSVRELKILREKFITDLFGNNRTNIVDCQFEITREKIRKIEEKALKRLRDHP